MSVIDRASDTEAEATRAMFWDKPANPDHGIFDGDAFISYADVWSLGDRLASAAGLPDKALACLFVDNSAASVAAYLGFLRAGHAVLLGDARWSVNNQRRLLDRYRPDVVCWPGDGPDGRRADIVGDHIRRDVRGDVGQDVDPISLYVRSVDDPHRNGPVHADLALLLATSGTTGDTRLVRLSHRAVADNADAIADFLDIDARERAITSLNMSYAYGLSVVNSHVARGASVVCSNLGVRDPAFWRQVVRWRCTSLAGVPAQYITLRADGYWREPARTIRTYTQAGGALSAEHQAYCHDQARKCGARLVVMYGQTEATARIAYVPPDALAAHLGAIGVAIPGGELTIPERDPDTGAGELYYRGVNVMMGYAESRACLSKGDELGGFLATGDIATRDADGYFRLVGRSKRMVKMSGVRVALDQLERMASERMASQGIGHAVAVVATGDDEPVTAFIECQRLPDGISGSELAGDLGLPAGLVIVRAIAEIPLTRRHKPDYRALTDLAREPAPEVNSPDVSGHVFADVSAREAEVAAVWTDVLGGAPTGRPMDEPLGVDDSFFAVGGNSLLAIQLVYKLRERGLHCELEDAFARPTIAGLARAVRVAAVTEDDAQRSGASASRDVSDERPLSENQRLYWRLHRWYRRAPVLNMTVMLEMRGPLVVGALRRAVDEVVQRHDILRTTYRFSGGRLSQHVTTEQAPALAMFEPDLGGPQSGPLSVSPDAEVLAEVLDELPSEIRTIADREANWRFDLAREPVVRFSLIRWTAERHVLIVVLHLVAGDGWSCEVLLNELVAGYNRHAGDGARPVPSPVHAGDLRREQYHDYAARARSARAGSESERLAYWRAQLSDMPRVSLPIDRPRPRRSTGSGRTIDFVIDANATARLQRLATRCRCTLYMVLLGGFHAFLWRATGQSDIPIGTTHANRSDTRSERLIGSVAETSIVRLPFAADLSVDEFLSRVRATVVRTMEIGAPPLDLLVGGAEQAVASAEWFPALFTYLNFPRASLDLVGLTTRRRPLWTAASKCDLILRIEPERHLLPGAWTYRTEVFSERRVRALLSGFTGVLDALCGASQQLMGELVESLDWSELDIVI